MPPPRKGTFIIDNATKDGQESRLSEKATHPVPGLTAAPDVVPDARAKPANRARYWGLGGLLAVALGLVMYFQPHLQFWTAQATIVGVETVALAPATRVLAVNGRIAASQSVVIRPLVSGILTDVSVTEGDVVAAGVDLARIDASTQQAAVRQALASRDEAVLALDEAQATYARSLSLEGNVSRIALENAARAVAMATQEVARMTALLDGARLRLADFTIRAPIAGTVLTLDADTGASVDPLSVLMTLADLSRLEVETDVDEDYATQIFVDQRATLQLAGETTLRDGHVSAVSRWVDEATGGLAVTLAFDTPVTAPIGLTVITNIVVDSRAQAMTLPRAAIVTDTEGASVFVFEEGTAQRRSVEVIDWPAARLIVTEGVAAGDVVISDATGITDGQAVSKAAP